MAPTADAHPADYRGRILLAAVVAMAVWWGLGLPYSVTVWLLDAQQLRWTLICYAWEVPVAGLLGPVLVPQLWWRDAMARWDRAFATPGRVDATEAAALEGILLDYPMRVGWALLVTSLVGYGVGALQLYVFAELPVEQLVHVGLLGVVTGLVGALFAFLYLERLLAPLLFALGSTRSTAPSEGRHVPLRRKVFACSVVLTVATGPLFGTLFWNQTARVLEQESGKRLLALVRDAAGVPEIAGGVPGEAARQALADSTELGGTGRAYVVDRTGRVVAGMGPAARLEDEGFRAAVTDAILTRPDGYLVDRTYLSRIVAFAAGADGRRAVVVVPRTEFDQELRAGLRTAAVIFLATLLLALGSSYLFSRRLGRPIELVTAMANRMAREPEAQWEHSPVRTNDEVGELAVALNHMTSRLGEAHEALARYNVELEDRVNATILHIRALYDTTRAITSTLETDDVVRLIEERLVAALGARDLVLLRASPIDATVDAYATTGGRFALGSECDLDAIGGGSHRPSVRSFAAVVGALPLAVRPALSGPEILSLPLSFKGRLQGVILASVPAGGAPDLDFAGSIASQTAVALANVALFEAAHRHESELRELSERQVQLREQMLREMSRELHDGLGQVLAAIKIDLGAIAQTESAPASLRDRVHGVQTQVTDLIKEVRRMSQLLRPSMLDDLGLVPSLRMLVESVAARSGIVITLTAPAVERRLPPEIEVLLYRVTQEALTNMVKHAHAHTGHVDLALRAAGVTLTIHDDGVGFDADAQRRVRPPSGVGLLGMRERVAYHRGSIEVRSRPGEGVRIALSIPVAG